MCGKNVLPTQTSSHLPPSGRSRWVQRPADWAHVRDPSPVGKNRILKNKWRMKMDAYLAFSVSRFGSPPPPHPLLHLTIPLVFSSPQNDAKTIKTWRPRQFREKTDFEMAINWLIDWVCSKCHGTNKLIDWLISTINKINSKLWIDRLIDWLIDVQHSRSGWHGLRTCWIRNTPFFSGK